jgi:hypothetical protein
MALGLSFPLDQNRSIADFAPADLDEQVNDTPFGEDL